VERLFDWLSRYRRLNIVCDRAANLFAGFLTLPISMHRVAKW
jgi:hypothetical protein